MDEPSLRNGVPERSEAKKESRERGQYEGTGEGSERFVGGWLG